MNVFAWFKLWILEQRLNFGAFGLYNRYRRWCLERNARTVAERIAIAKEVLRGPGVNTMEAQANELYLRRAEVGRQQQNSSVVQGTPPPDVSIPAPSGQQHVR